MDAELDLDYFWCYLGVANAVPFSRDSWSEHCNDALGTYCMGGEL